MPVNTPQATRWGERARAQYLLDPDTGLPTGSANSPLEVRQPGLDFLGGTSFALDGAVAKWLVPPDGSTIITIAANGGEVYYSINGITADATSPGYVADGTVQRIGPVCNMTSLWVFSATADTQVHANYYRETNSALAGAWRFIPADVPQGEADALIWLYDTLDGENWTNNTGWKTDPVVNNWYGVTVAGGHVTELSMLGDNGLAGDISGFKFSWLPNLIK